MKEFLALFAVTLMMLSAVALFCSITMGIIFLAWVIGAPWGPVIVLPILIVWIALVAAVAMTAEENL